MRILAGSRMYPIRYSMYPHEKCQVISRRISRTIFSKYGAEHRRNQGFCGTMVSMGASDFFGIEFAFITN